MHPSLGTSSFPRIRSAAALGFVAFALALVVSPGCAARTDAAEGAPAKLNERFVDPGLEVQEWIDRFEVESREVYAERHAVVEAVGVERAMRVADVGAGTGLFTRLFAERVGPEGRVYAVDISPKFIDHIDTWASEDGVEHVVTVLGTDTSAELAPESVDLAFVCDTYHHFEDPDAMLASMRAALVPDGRLVVIDFERVPGVSSDWILDHVRAGKAVFRAEIEAAGFELVEEVDMPGFEENYVLVFRKGS